MRGERLVEFEHISGGKPNGAYSGWQRPCYVVLWDAEAWEYIWRIHCRVSPNSPRVPDIDFEKDMVIALFRGQCEYYGYWIEVRRITLNEGTNTLTVHYWMNAVKVSGEPTMSTPYHIVAIPKSGAKIQFVRTFKW
jgi:hypothetical protein